MKTPDNKNKLPADLDALMQDMSEDEIAGLNEVWSMSAAAQGEAPDADRLDGIFSEIESTIDQEGKREPVIHQLNSQSSAQLIPIRWMAAAASIIIAAIGLGYLLEPVTVTAPMGEIAQVVLHDGSQVELNSGSTLSYGRWFGDERRVRLEGEAFFDVVKDEKQFIVETFNASVTVLGTSFNVKAWSSAPEEQTKVALRTGKVSLERLGDVENDVITLSPGQTGLVGERIYTSSEADTVIVSRALAWRNGAFFFSDELLGSILADVERKFDTQIELTPASLSSRRMKFAMDQPDEAENIVTVIAETLGLKYRETALGFEIFDPN